MRSFRLLLARLLAVSIIVTLFIPQTVFAGTQAFSGSYIISDARTSELTTISANDGKAKVLVFGSYSKCPNTKKTLNILSDIMDSGVSTDDLTVAYFAVTGDLEDGNTIAQVTSSLSTKILVANIVNSNGNPTYAGKQDSPYIGLVNSCANFSNIHGSYTMPMVVYVDKHGNMINSSTGGKTEVSIKNNIADLGIGYSAPTSYSSSIDVVGSREYALAYEVFNQLNEYRVANGLNKLTMDTDLLEAAMMRSAEITVLFEHDRPNGYDCASACPDKLMGENIACYQPNADTVMNAWKNSPGHNANMLNSKWNSVGIGVYSVNGELYWSQEFGECKATPDSKYSNITSVDFATNVDFSTSMVNISLIYSKLPFSLKVNNYMDSSLIYVGGYVAKSIPGFTLTSSDTSVLKVDATTGRVTAVGPGSANLQLKCNDTIISEMTIDVAGTTTATTVAPTKTPTSVPTKAPVVTTAPTSIPDKVTSTPNPTSKPNVTTTVAPTVNPTVEPSGNDGSGNVTSTPTFTPTSAPGGNGLESNPTSMPTNTPETTGTGVSAFAERLYTTCLGRDSEPSGKDYWVSELKKGKAGSEVAEQFFFSPEFVNSKFSNTEFITRLYLTFMGREPDANGVNYWLGQLASGKDRRFVFDGFVNSDEWATICLGFGIRSGGTGTPTSVKDPSQPIIDFAERLYTTCLGRKAEESGLNYWSFELANLRRTGTEAAMGFFFSDEFVGLKLNNREYITRLYRTFMGREPEQGGIDYWLGQLGSGATRTDVFYGFATAPEFAELCAEAGIMS